MFLGGFITGNRVYQGKLPKDSRDMTIFQPKMLDCYAASACGMIAGSLFGPFMVPIAAAKMVYEWRKRFWGSIYATVTDKDVIFVPK